MSYLAQSLGLHKCYLLLFTIMDLESEMCHSGHKSHLSIVENVNNQQNATNFSFIILFKSAQHVSGDKLAHPHEHFLTVYTAFGTMNRLCCRLTMAPIGSIGGSLYRKLYIQLKSGPEDGRVCRPKHVGLI